jgi:glutaredoxin
VPALDALVHSFAREANTICVGISVDSRHCHANWAFDLGGISLPLLADFHPRGAVAKLYGVWLEERGISDRATVIVDTEGVVRFAASVGPSGRRDIDELFARAKEIHGGTSEPESVVPCVGGQLATDATLYVREGCGFCRSVLRAIGNLKCGPDLRVRDVTTDPSARAELDAIAGPGAKVPVLVQNGKALGESAEIIKALAEIYVLR